MHRTRRSTASACGCSAHSLCTDAFFVPLTLDRALIKGRIKVNQPARMMLPPSGKEHWNGKAPLASPSMDIVAIAIEADSRSS